MSVVYTATIGEVIITYSTIPKFPHIEVNLVGQNGNAFVIMGLVIRALRKGKVAESDITTYREEATHADYDHLLRITMQTVNVT